jgi:mono/diheme cytochrome c family protein
MKKACPTALLIIVALASARPAAAAPDGKALYASKCAMCHGQDGVPKKMGTGSKAFGDAEFKKTATPESILADIHDGKGKMKPVKSVSDDEAMAIARYILTIVPAK